MIILNDKKLIGAEFDNEQEIENVVVDNSEYFFGSSSIFIPKKLIKTKDGFGTIPDGFAIDLSSRSWYVVEVELVKHNVWSHIAPQVAKQLIAVGRPETRQLLEELVVQMVTDDEEVKSKFEEENIDEIDIRKVVDEILSKPPTLGMPIDGVSKDLKDWAETLKHDVNLWVVKKYIEFGSPDNVAYDIPEEYKPAIDTSEEKSKPKSGMAYYDVSLADLLSINLLIPGQTLTMSYKPRGGQRKEYQAVVNEEGTMTVLDKTFRSPSFAALLGIQDAGSGRTTVNGWTSWKTHDEKWLVDLRSSYLQQKEQEAKQEAQAYD